MNTPSPLVPQGSLNQPKKKLTFPVAVFTILSLHILFIGIMLIQGCNRNTPKKTEDTGLSDTNNTSLPAFGSAATNNLFGSAISNAAIPPLATTNFVTSSSNLPANPDTLAPPVKSVETTAPSEAKDYAVVKGDTMGKIARKHGISLSALKKANPGVEPTKLKVGQKLKIPAGASTSEEKPSTAGAGADTGDGAAYTVKAGDTLSKIAKAHGTSAKKLRAFNGLSTDRLKVGQKLKIPAGGAAAMASAKADTSSGTNSDTGFSNTFAPAPAATNILR